MEAIKTMYRKNEDCITFGYSVNGEPKEILKLINHKDFIPFFDKEGKPVLWTKRQFESYSISIKLTDKRIVLIGEEL